MASLGLTVKAVSFVLAGNCKISSGECVLASKFELTTALSSDFPEGISILVSLGVLGVTDFSGVVVSSEGTQE